MNHGLDTDTQVFFYEQEFYVLSNFSSFQVEWRELLFPTSEHAYHCAKFLDGNEDAKTIAGEVLEARSAHDAFKIAQEFRELRRPDWDVVKIAIMHEILVAKTRQHDYVRHKLMQTGDRILIENSWRDDFWGWGPNKDGKNVLGQLWMKVREEVRTKWL